MNNAELIAALRYCPSHGCASCPSCDANGRCLQHGVVGLMHNAADLIEAQAKRIEELNTKCADLQSQINSMENEIEELLPKEGEWIMDEHPHDGDCRCSVCLVAIDAMHERNHGVLNALTGGKWWRFYHYCPNCGARMKGEQE